MTKLSRLLFSAVPCLMFTPAFVVHASPLVSIGDNADLFFNGSSSVRWTSNLFRDEFNEEEDLIYTISPGFELNLGRGLGEVDFGIVTSYDIIRYQDNDDLDTELFHIRSYGSYRGSRLDVTTRASFDERQTTTGDGSDINLQGELIESERTAARVDFEYRLSPKFSFGSGASYSKIEYTSFEERFNDRENFTIPLDVYYELTPKVDLSMGYAYTHVEVDGRTWEAIDRIFEDYDYDSHFFNVGARGQLLPKLSGFFKIGYRLRESYEAERTTLGGVPVPSTEEDDTGSLGLDADLTWAATPKLTTRMGLSRDFGVSGEGGTTENTSFDLNASYSITPHWSASSNLGYTLREYDSGREDDQYFFGLRASYNPNRYWRFSGGYRYVENDSDRFNASYDAHEFDLTATLRY